MNYDNPDATLTNPLNDGFVRVNHTAEPTGTSRFNLLNKYHAFWADYFEDLPQSTLIDPVDLEHQQQIDLLYLTLAGTPFTSLPQARFVDPDFGVEGYAFEDNEHPPTDIGRDQQHVTHIANALHHGPYWKNTMIFFTCDKHGGFFDHARPPAAPQALVRTPAEVFPGQC
ncbi:MAG: alkaline phosphatase family protein [Acidocella sp.]|nr:alkaline phosphatase family protein [Acidocella sp.]